MAGPYSEGNVNTNVHRARGVGTELIQWGYNVFVPHLNHYMPDQSYETWMRQDFAILRKCDVLLRMPGPSAGTHREVQRATWRGIPVVYSVDEVLDRVPIRDCSGGDA